MRLPHSAAFILSCLAIFGAVPAPAAPAAAYQLVERLKVSDGGFDYATFDPATGHVYMARPGFTEVVDVKTGAVTRLTSAAGGHIALPIPGTSLLLLAQGAGTIRIADAATDKVLADLPAGMNPDGAAYDPFTKLVFVMNHGSGDSTVVDPATRKVVATIEVGGTLEFAASDGAGKVFVNVEDRNEIAVIDVKTMKTTARYKLAGCDAPTGLAYVAPLKLLVSSCDGTAKIVQAADGKEVASLAIGGGADAVIYDPVRRLALIPCSDTGTLEVISLGDAAHIAVIQHAMTQVGTRTGTVDPATGRIYLMGSKTDPNPAAPVGRGGRARLAGSFEVLVVAP